MNRKIIYPYHMGSRSSKDLSASIGGLRVHPNRKYKPRQSDLIVNWGNSQLPSWFPSVVEVGANILNQPLNIRVATNKLTTFRQLELAGIPIPKYTTDRITANDYSKVFVRHKLSSHSGDGIEIFNEGGELPLAPLYTEYIKQRAEYRVHVFNGEIISYSKKMRRRNFLDYPTEEQKMIRSYKNGWVFCRNGLKRLVRVEKIAKDAVSALGLDFGGVDIIRDRNGNVFVLEINTACGLQGRTLEDYKNAILNYAN